jgi:hypothetical protein
MSMRHTVILATVALLAGCTADERAHVVKLDKGVYAGAADTQLSEATREALKLRVQSQRFGADLNQSLRPAALPEGGTAPAEGRMAGQNY